MARKDIAMTKEEQLAFIAAGLTLQVTTIGGDGWPHVAPMWYFPRGETVAFRTFTKSQKLVNLARNPKITVLLETGERYEELRGLTIKGIAELSTDRQVLVDAYVELAVRYDYPAGSREAGSIAPETAEQMFGRLAEKNTYVHVRPEKVISWDHRKLGGAY